MHDHNEACSCKFPHCCLLVIYSCVTFDLQGEFVSMGVVSTGAYGVSEGIVYSYPMTISNNKWQIVQGLNIDDFSREKMDATAKELLEEKNACEAFLQE